ncbi:MAG: carbohydrate-binding family 9-like protein [Polyangiaceae bacterium]
MAGAVGVIVALAVGLAVRQLLARRAAPPRAPGAASSRFGVEDVLHVPHLPGSVTLDGDSDDPVWTQPPGPARTGAFRLPSGAEARPYTSARLLWGDGHLYLSLYAADEDIESRTDQPDGPLWLDDSFRLSFSQGDVERVIEVSPRGVVTDSIRRGGRAYDYGWSSGVHVSPERDGTLNKPDDMDEEWVIEMAVPLESIALKGEPGERTRLSIVRCDTPKNSGRVCTSWESTLVLD